MSNYVYSGASWKCTNGGCGKIRNNNSQKINGNGILTIADLPVSDGTSICAVLQGAPCVPVCIPGSWQNKSLKVKSNNIPVLLSNSTIICSVAVPVVGVISITQSSNNVKTGNPFNFSGRNTNVDSPVDKEQIGTSESNQSLNSNSSDIQPPPSDKSYTSPNYKLGEDLHEKYNDDSDNASTIINEEKVSSPKENRKNRWCSGRCPAEFKGNCEFCKAPENYIVDNQLRNNSDILKNNLQSIFGYDKIAEKIRNTKIKLKDNYVVDWLVPQHHHIISGNECLYRRNKEDNSMLFPLLVKLANLFKYNVNSFLNGIILSGYNTQKLTNIVNSEKFYLAYEIMKKEIGNTDKSFGMAPEIYKFTGSQLHFGQHTYQNDLKKLKEKYRTKYPKLNFVKVYEDIVLKHLNVLSEYVYKNRYDKVCFIKDFVKEKEFFEKYLNSISEKIRRNIKEFPRKGKLNLAFEEPAYVSISALAYDIGISVEELNEVLL